MLHKSIMFNQHCLTACNLWQPHLLFFTEDIASVASWGRSCSSPASLELSSASADSWGGQLIVLSRCAIVPASPHLSLVDY